LIPAHDVVLEANGVEQRRSIKPEDVSATFQVNLPKGKGRLQGWFRDADGKDLCGAYYALVTKLPA